MLSRRLAISSRRMWPLRVLTLTSMICDDHGLILYHMSLQFYLTVDETDKALPVASDLKIVLS